MGEINAIFKLVVGSYHC